jgi:hypothetical protein
MATAEESAMETITPFDASVDFPSLNANTHKRSRDSSDSEPENHLEKQSRKDGAQRFPRYFLIAAADANKPMTRISPTKGLYALKSLVGTVEKVIRQQNGNLIVGLQRPGQVRNLMDTKEINSIPCIVSSFQQMNSKKGVIRCSALRDIPEEEIVEDLSSEGVIAARKLYFTKDGRRLTSNTVILTFDGSVLPKVIKAGYLNLKVEPYIPNPLRCFNCNRFGHPRDKCKRKACCARCGKEDHEDDKMCAESPHCVNCLGDHQAYSRDCPIFLEEKSIQRLRVTENLSFPEARQRIRPSPSQPGRSYSSVVKKTVSSIATQVDMDKDMTGKIVLPTPRPTSSTEATPSGARSTPAAATRPTPSASTAESSASSAEPAASSKATPALKATSKPPLPQNKPNPNINKNSSAPKQQRRNQGDPPPGRKK